MPRRKQLMTDKQIIKYVPSQLENESDLEYAWLQVYCMQGMSRSLESVVALLKQQETQNLLEGNVSESYLYDTIKTASSNFDWTNRAQQYDVNRWAKNIDELADIYAQIDTEWQTKCEDTRVVISETIKTALDIQITNNIILENVKYNVKEYQDNMLAMFKLQKALRGVSDTALNALEILTKAWQIKEHTETIQMAESWQQQALEALRKQ